MRLNNTMKYEIRQGDCISEMKLMEEEGVDLIIADPPYWKVVNEKWDHQWKTEEDYIKWSIEWLKEATRILRKGGTLYLFGYFRTLALMTTHFKELGLELRQQIIIDKGMRSVSGRATKNYKIFPNTTESCLFLVKDSKFFIKDFLKNHQKKLNLSSKEINEALGVKSNGGGMWSIYTGKNICEQMPTFELWQKLQEILKFDFPYNKIAQTFNPEMGITDVWRDIDFYNEQRFHTTQKPIKLISRLINASSNKGDMIIDPFGGSGATLLSAYTLERQCIIIEKELEHYQTISKRFIEVQNNFGDIYCPLI